MGKVRLNEEDPENQDLGAIQLVQNKLVRMESKFRIGLAPKYC